MKKSRKLLSALLAAVLVFGLFAVMPLTAGAAASAPVITSQPASVTVAEGGNATFTVKADGDAPLSYEWYYYHPVRRWSMVFDNTEYSGAKTQTLTLTNVKTEHDGMRFRCMVTNPAGHVNSNEATLTVDSVFAAVSNIEGPATMTLAAGYEATSSGVFTITGEPAPTVTKTSGDSKITWNNSTKKLDIAAGLAPGSYQVILKAANDIPPDTMFTFTLTVTAESVSTPFPFTDVKPGDWFYNDVKTAWEQGLINGKTTTLFAPGDYLTYSEAVKLAACMHQLYTTGSVTLVSGVNPSQWYQTYVDYAKSVGIIGTDYVWDAPATRAGYMAIFANALPASAFAAINTVPDDSIPDVKMSHPQAAAIYKLYRAGILQGVDAAHNCDPGSNIKRSEVAAILTRMMNDAKRISFSL